jgi:hypothetical protein
MLRKFLVGFMAFAMVTVQANAVSNNNLKTAFDELNYALSVEWDQQDRNFYDAQMQKFTSKIKELQAQGMTNSELVEFALANIKDANMAKEVRTALTVVQINKMSTNEARKMVMETMAKSYNQGASWTGDGVLLGAAIVLLLVAVIVVAASAGGNGNVSTGPSCYDEYVCYDYYDSWGYYWYSDCFYETVCY